MPAAAAWRGAPGRAQAPYQQQIPIRRFSSRNRPGARLTFSAAIAPPRGGGRAESPPRRANRRVGLTRPVTGAIGLRRAALEAASCSGCAAIQEGVRGRDKGEQASKQQTAQPALRTDSSHVWRDTDERVQLSGRSICPSVWHSFLCNQCANENHRAALRIEPRSMNRNSYQYAKVSKRGVERQAT